EAPCRGRARPDGRDPLAGHRSQRAPLIANRRYRHAPGLGRKDQERIDMTPVPSRPRASVRRLAGIAAVGAVVSLALGGTALELTDGREIKGDDLRMEGNLYMLTSHGTVVPIPKEAVKSVKWIEEQPSKGSAPVANIVTSKTDAERQEAAQRRAARDAEQQ